MMEYIGYFLAVIIGVTLGLIGSGGSILAVPVLVYVFSLDAVLATSYSLFIVGITSAIGSVNYFRKGLVNIKTVLAFGTPSVAAVLITRAYVLPAIPHDIFSLGSFVFTKDLLLMLLFAVLMIAASYNMIKPQSQAPASAHKQDSYILILTGGILVGIITGLVGVGGGFLIIPALIVFYRLKMKEAVGTSLAIISANALIGFFGTHNTTATDWKFLFVMSAFATAGIFIGALLAKKIDGDKLKPAFGWFVLVMGIYIIFKEIFSK